MYETPEAPLLPHMPAPGANAAFQCGLWSILTNAVLGCFPVAIALGIIAIVQHGKAETAHQLDPERYDPPGMSGRVMGIVGICLTLVAWLWLGLIASWVVPGLRGARRARPSFERTAVDPAAEAKVRAQVDQAEASVKSVCRELTKGPEGRLDPDRVVQAVLARGEMQFPRAENAYAPGRGPFRRADAPDVDGEVTLDPRPSYRDYKKGGSYPAIIIRGRWRLPGGGVQLVERVVALPTLP